MNGGTMPIYEYECASCGKIFTAALSLREHDEKNVVCPGCGSKKVEQLITSFIAKTDRKS
jgi:putative FmdB family regulatory protein